VGINDSAGQHSGCRFRGKEESDSAPANFFDYLEPVIRGAGLSMQPWRLALPACTDALRGFTVGLGSTL
jgi:hypothetical protein